LGWVITHLQVLRSCLQLRGTPCNSQEIGLGLEVVNLDRGTVDISPGMGIITTVQRRNMDCASFPFHVRKNICLALFALENNSVAACILEPEV
jgi:hypothetical protein